MQLRTALLVATIGCGAGPGAAPRAAGPPGEQVEAAPGLRLPRTFVPTAYAARLAIYEAFKAHYDAFAALLPPEFVPQLSQVGFVLCDPALRDDVVQFFRDRLSRVAGGPHMLAMGIERMDACLARRRAAQPSIQAFLASH